MTPLHIDPIAEARRHWAERWGEEPARPMAAVTSIMRAQQVLMARLNDLLRPLGLTFPRYEALMLLSFTRTGALPLGKIGEAIASFRSGDSAGMRIVNQRQFDRLTSYLAQTSGTVALGGGSDASTLRIEPTVVVDPVVAVVARADSGPAPEAAAAASKPAAASTSAKTPASAPRLTRSL